jgi:predicted ATPase
MQPGNVSAGRASFIWKETRLITRLEVDGFKNLIGFSVDFAPYTCIAGPNGVGKSNVFDAIRFLSLLADHTLTEAALLVRGSGVEAGEVADLFWSDGVHRRDEFMIAAEMIIDPHTSDDFGRAAEARSTYLRYVVRIGYEAASARGSLDRLVLLSESLDYIKEDEAVGRLRFPLSAQKFRDEVVHNKRKAESGYISALENEDGQTEILVHGDGGSRGRPQRSPAGIAPKTIVATSNTSDTPTILAARREMQRWRFLALEPTAMRNPDRFHTDPHVTASGGHIASTLNRLGNEAEARGEDRETVFASIAQRLRELVPISDLEVEVDEVRKLFTVEARENTGVRLPAASLSDGTLRFLALSVLVADPQAEGVLCIEEPENGVHPAKMPEMVRLLRDLAVDASKKPGPENPFRQVIIATHSPVFVQMQHHDDLLFATEAKVKGKDGQPVRTLRCRPLSETWRAKAGEPPVGMATILAYLSAPPGAQLELPALSEMTR